MMQCKLKLKKLLRARDKNSSLCHLGLCLQTNITELVKSRFKEKMC